MKVILVSGKAQSGKDTFASILRENLVAGQYRVLITHYADLLKYICCNYLGWDGKKDEKGRKMLQYVGTDIVRKQNPTLWVDFVSMILKYFYENWDYVIIPDCRFRNEITTMIENGFDTIHIRVVRQSYNNALTTEQKKHISETSLDDIEPDYYIYNSGTLSDFRETTLNWIKENLYGI